MESMDISSMHVSSMHICDPAFRIEVKLDLPDDEVHLWRLDLATVGPAEEKWQRILSSDELARAARFHFPRDRQRFTATRACLRTLLGGYVDCFPTEIVFRYSANEKPSLSASHSASQLEFNVSHSGTVALLAFARGRELGVDIEQVRAERDYQAIARRFFSVEEQSQLAALPAADLCHGFFRCWTRKEAFIKATGDGLSLPLDQFDVSLKPADENALLATRPDGAEAARWSLREVPAGEGYLAALCVHGRGWWLKSWR